MLSYPSAMTVSSRAVNLLVVVARGDHEGAGQVGSRAVRSCAYLPAVASFGDALVPLVIRS